MSRRGPPVEPALVRRPVVLALALGLVRPLHAAPELAPEAAAAPSLPPELALPGGAAGAQAQTLAAAGRHLEAARIYEDAWAQVRDVRLLYHAGLARARAGHHAIAALHHAEFLGRAGTLARDTRAHVDARIAEARGRTAAVKLRILDGEGSEVSLPEPTRAATRLTFTYMRAGDDPDSRARFEIVGPREAPVLVDPGPWTVRVEAPGRATVEALLVAGDGATWEVVVPRPIVEVELRFKPDSLATHGRVELRASDRPGVPRISRELRAPELKLELATGPWQLEASAPPYEAQQGLTIAPGMPPVEIELRRPSEPVPRPQHRRVIGLSVSGAAVGLGGWGVFFGGLGARGGAGERDGDARAAAGASREGRAPLDAAQQVAVEAAYPTARYHRDITRAYDLVISGMTMAVAGTAGVFGAIPIHTRGRRAAYVEIGLGGALLIGGAAWLAHHLRERAALLGPDTPDQRATSKEIAALLRPAAGSAALTGVGLGLVVFPALDLLVESLQRRRGGEARASLRPGPGPGPLGLSLRGRF